MNDALAEFREKQRQKYLERQRNDGQRNDEANKPVTAPAQTTSPSSASTFPPTIGTVPASTAQVSPNLLERSIPARDASPVIPAEVATIRPSTSRDEELARRLQEEEDARQARELAEMDNQRATAATNTDDVRPPDTQFTERLLDTPAITYPSAYTRSLFSPDAVRPAVQVPPQLQRNDYHAYGTRPSTLTRTIQMPLLGHVNPLAPTMNYGPGDAPTLRNDQSPPRHFLPPTTTYSSQMPTAHPPLITPHLSTRPPFLRQNPVYARSPNHSGSWVSTPSPIPSDPEEDVRERQLREDEALARRLQEEDGWTR